jgi:hypothetical protein
MMGFEYEFAFLVSGPLNCKLDDRAGERDTGEERSRKTRVLGCTIHG